MNRRFLSDEIYNNMESAHPLFSIITVTYNAAHTLERTMLSISAQSCKSYEHIIMDGVSKDDTLAIARKYESERTRIISKPDKGLYDAMNNAMSVAKGEYLIFLNAGDKFHSEDTLQEFADAIVSNDHPGIVYGQTNLVDDNGSYIGPRHLTAPQTLNVKSFRNGMVVCHQAMAVQRHIAPPYDLHWRFSADFEWCIKCLSRSHRNVYIDDTLIDYLYEGMTTQNHKASLRERFRIMSHYYGWLPTILKHIGFVARGLKRKMRNPRARQ